MLLCEQRFDPSGRKFGCAQQPHEPDCASEEAKTILSNLAAHSDVLVAFLPPVPALNCGKVEARNVFEDDEVASGVVRPVADTDLGLDALNLRQEDDIEQTSRKAIIRKKGRAISPTPTQLQRENHAALFSEGRSRPRQVWSPSTVAWNPRLSARTNLDAQRVLDVVRIAEITRFLHTQRPLSAETADKQLEAPFSRMEARHSAVLLQAAAKQKESSRRSAVHLRTGPRNERSRAATSSQQT